MNEANGEVSKSNGLFWALGILCFVMILLVTGVLIKGYLDASKEGEIEEATEWTGLEAEISMAESVDEAVKVYGKYLDAAKSDDEKVDILNQRIDYIFQNDEEGAYSGQAMEDVIAIDGILKSVSSAAQVANVADDLGDKNIAKKYEQIADERSIAEGDDLDDQGNG